MHAHRIQKKLNIIKMFKILHVKSIIVEKIIHFILTNILMMLMIVY